MSEEKESVWGKCITKKELEKILEEDIDNKQKVFLAPYRKEINYYKALRFVLVDIIAHTASTARNYPEMGIEDLQQQGIDYFECYIDMRLKGYRGE